MQTMIKTTPDAVPLAEAERDAALRFLDRRPVHNVIMSGWMMEHGVVSPRHRGTFYRTLDADGNISGVALIGRNTFFETLNEQALRSFAEEARRHAEVAMLFGEPDELAGFWRNYRPAAPNRSVRKAQLLFERRHVPAARHPEFRLRPARGQELDQVVDAHALMVLDETGVDPLAADADGFTSRCRQRIEEGKTWVCAGEGGEVIFKTEIVSRTPKVVYIEGVWVNPKYRGRNVAKKCLENLCHTVLDGSNEICGFVDGSDHAAVSLYRRAGFDIDHEYAKVYV